MNNLCWFLQLDISGGLNREGGLFPILAQRGEARGINLKSNFNYDASDFVKYNLNVNEKHKIQIKQLTKCCVSTLFLFMITGDPIACSLPRIS